MGAIKGINIKLWTANISASRQNIKNLIDNFRAIHVRIMHANFQVSSFTGVGGEWGGRQMDTGHQGREHYTEFLNSSLTSLGMDKDSKQAMFFLFTGKPDNCKPQMTQSQILIKSVNTSDLIVFQLLNC